MAYLLMWTSLDLVRGLRHVFEAPQITEQSKKPEGLNQQRNLTHPKPYNVGALILRIGLGGRLYYNYYKEPPQSPILSIHVLFLDDPRGPTAQALDPKPFRQLQEKQQQLEVWAGFWAADVLGDR